MKKITIFLFCLLILPAAPLPANQIRSLSSAEAVSFHPPRLRPVALSNGMRCYFMEDHSLPIIQGSLILKGGWAYENIREVGVSGVMSSLLNDGGTLKNSPEKIREILDGDALSVSFSSDSENVTGYFGGTSDKMDMLMGIFFEMLFEPAFDAKELVTVKQRINDSLKRDLELPSPVAAREFRRMLYGKDTRWGVSATPSMIRKISQKGIRNFYDRFVSPDQMILAVAGDFKKAELLKKLEGLAAIYKKRATPEVALATVSASDFPEERPIIKKFTQSSVNIGHLSTDRYNPDKYAIFILDDILGGSAFSSRLMDTVRVKNGLAYEIWSDFSFGPKGVPGTFQVHAKTRNKVAGKAVQLIKDEIARIVEAGVTEEEFRNSKNGVLNNLVFNYEKSFDTAAAIARFVSMGYPEDYIEVFRRGVANVKLADVNAAAKKYLHPDKLKIVVVGGKGAK